jgi:hypothetical protein
MWYHTSGDTPDKSDATQLKRVVVIGAASAVCLAGGGPPEVERMIAEVAMRSYGRLGQEKTRAQDLLLSADKAKVRESYKDADNILNQAFLRQEDVLGSLRFFTRNDPALENLLKIRIQAIDEMRLPGDREIWQVYAARCRKEGLTPERLTLTAEEIRLGKLVPVRTEKMKGYFDSQAFGAQLREKKDAPAYQLGRAEYIVRNYLDGKRSILQIRNAAAAEVGNIPLKEVEN